MSKIQQKPRKEYTVIVYYPSGRSRLDRTYKSLERATKRMLELQEFNEQQNLIGYEPICDYRLLTSERRA